MKSVQSQLQLNRKLPCDRLATYALTGVGCYNDALNVNVDVVREILRHPEPVSADARGVACNPRDDELASNDSSLDVGSDISSNVEQVKTLMI